MSYKRWLLGLMCTSILAGCGSQVTHSAVQTTSPPQTIQTNVSSAGVNKNVSKQIVQTSQQTVNTMNQMQSSLSHGEDNMQVNK